MFSPTNETLATGLEETARLLGDDRRKAALWHAAAVLRRCPDAVTARIERDGLEGVHALGIGYELAGAITDWVRSGQLRWREQLLAERRRELLRVSGLNRQLADALYEVLGIVDVEGLARAAREGQLLRVCGFGPKRVQLLTAQLCGARAAG